MTTPEKFEEAKKMIARQKQRMHEIDEILKKEYYRKSKYPPMAIEPFPSERERLPFKMTTEDRALRQQWLKDQIMSPNEPRYVPELRPRNWFRRVAGAPWDVVTNALLPKIGISGGHYFRFLAPKFAMSMLGLFTITSYFKNNHASWEKVQGWNIYHNRQPVYPGVDPTTQWGARDYHEKHASEFNDRGFSQRNVLLD